MSTTRAPSTSYPASAFQNQRALLVGEIATSLEQVLQSINKLNRAIEAVITVGNEFSAVEALWSQFEGVMVPEEGERERDLEAEEERQRQGEGGGGGGGEGGD